MKQPPDDLAAKLLAASDQFQGTGLDVSIDEVAKAADVPRATLYYYFSGKDDLASFFINDKLNRGAQILEKAVAMEGSATERLETVVRAMVEAMSEYPVLCTELPFAMRRLGSYEATAMHADRVMMAPLRELLIEGRAAGELQFGDVGVTTAAMGGMIMQVTQMAAMASPDGHFDHESVSNALVPLLFNGLAA